MPALSMVDDDLHMLATRGPKYTDVMGATGQGPQCRRGGQASTRMCQLERLVVV